MNVSLPAMTTDRAGTRADSRSAEPVDATPSPVILVGMMGAGKTTIGRHLAHALERKFLDLDHELEARCGVRVALIFEIEGEAGFRKRETALLDECSQYRGMVLATGGGAVLAAENRRVLKERGTVVYLRASVDDLFRRVARDRNRPLLRASDPRQRIADLLDQREPLYEEVADITLNTGDMPVAQVLRNLLPHIRELETL